jgi:flagellar motility protein MotE (MotC chaperone)
MKKLFQTLVLTLAFNFVLAVCGVAYLFKTGALTHDKVTAIKAVLYPAATQPTTQPEKTSPDATTQPTLRLEELLAKVSGRPAGQQVEFLQRTFDAQMAELDRRDLEVRRNAAEAKAALENATKERERLLALQKQLDQREKALTTQVQDKGFEDSLNLYNSMTPKQVKDAFAGLDDPTATKYLRAMEPTRAAKIFKEFKTPQEIERVQRIMDLIRQPQADAKASP